MAKASHKILRQVMQLTYGDADTAFRLQDRICTLQRNRLEQVIERVMEEFEVPGEVVRVKSLELDLGHIEEIDLDLLLPLALEQALRNELGQLMIRKQYDPLVEVDTLTITEGGVEDWLHYLENGIKRWHESSQELSIATLLKDLAPQGRERLRQRLIVLLGQRNALERLLGETREEDFEQLFFLLLGEKTAKEVLEWMATANASILRQNISILSHFTAKLRHNSSKIAQKNVAIAQKYLKTALLRSWAGRRFEPSRIAQVKAESLAIAQLQLHLAVDAPVPELEITDAGIAQYDSDKLLEYVLCYGCWPLGEIKAEKPFDLGEFVLAELRQNTHYVVDKMHKLLVYPSIRKRLVYQLSIIQFEEFVKIFLADRQQSFKIYSEWVETLPTTVKSKLQSAPVLRSGWLSVLEAMAAAPNARWGDKIFQEILLVNVVNQLSINEIRNIELLAEKREQLQEFKDATKRLIQLYKELKPNGGEGLEDVGRKSADSKDGTAAKTRPIVPKSLLQQAFSEMPEDVSLSKQSASGIKGNENKLLQTSDNQQDARGLITDEVIEPPSPKTLLEALLHYFNYGIWPELPLEENQSNVNGSIVVPATVLADLLQEKPTELAIALYPMLAVQRVRERIAFQLEDRIFQELVATYVSVHSPIAGIRAFYAQLQPLAALLPKALQSNGGADFRHFEAALKSFVLTVLYEEPNIVDLQGFVKQFLGYYLEESEVEAKDFHKIIGDVLPNLSIPETTKDAFLSALKYWESKANKDAGQPQPENGEMLLAAFDSFSEDIDLQPVSSLPEPTEPRENPITSIKKDLPEEQGNVSKSTDGTNLSEDSVQRQEFGDIRSQNIVNQEYTASIEDGQQPSSEKIETQGQQEEPASPISNESNNDNDFKEERAIGQPRELEGDRTTAVTPPAAPSDLVEKGNGIENQLVETQLEPVREGKNGIVDNAITPPDNHGDVREPMPTEDLENPDIQYPLTEVATLPFADAQSIINQEDAAEEPNPIARQTLKQKIDAILQRQIPEKVRQAKIMRPQNPFEREQPMAPLEDPVFIENAGVILLWPFVGRCFTTLGYMEKGLFKSMETATRAIHLLQYMATGEEQAPEHLLVLNKILCGIPIVEAIERDIVLTANEKEEADTLLKATIANWEKMNKISVAALRDSFLKRGGRLTENEVSWTLRVDQASYDMLLDTLPWTIGMIKLKCMEKVLYVEWR